jgi:hypothetical protein
MRIVTIPPGSSRSYDPAEWDDALVIIELGAMEMEGISGACRQFAIGSVLWLSGLPLRALHNRGTDLLILALILRIR